MQFWSVNNFDVFMCRKWHCKLTVIESINHKQVSQWWLHSRWELLSLKGNDGSSCWNVSLTFESSFSFCNWPRLFLVKMTKDGVSGWFPITGLGAMLLIRLSVPPEKTYWLDVTSNSTPPPPRNPTRITAAAIAIWTKPGWISYPPFLSECV